MRISRRGYLMAAASVAAISFSATKSFGQLVAFPGAEGYGALATGGRTGSVYVVTNLNNSGTGSFEDAVSQSNRIVVFAVGGYIDANAPISVASNVTILGQTAPGQGIGIMGDEVSFSAKNNDIVQYMRFREGGSGSSTEDSVDMGDGTDMIFDHDSFEYGPYNNIDASGTVGIGNITLQNSIIANPTYGQQFNLHIQGNTASYPNSITIANNIFANGDNRSPLAKCNDQYVNNIVYNYRAGYTVANTGGAFTQDIINNYFISGTSTTSDGDAFFQMDSNISAYASGNLLLTSSTIGLNGSPLSPGGVTTLTSAGLPGTSALPTLSTAAAFAFDTAHAGASLSYDSVDSQVISDVESLGSEGSIINTPGDTGISNGGFGTITGGTNPTSTANDGIPDTWAVTHGLSVTDSTGATKKSALGYDMIEEYADQLADTLNSQTWSSGSGEWTTNSSNWSSTLPGIYDHALIRGNGTSNGSVTISNSGATAFSLSIGGNGPAAGESAYVNGGSLTIYNTVTVGDQNNALLQITSGILNAGNVQLGNTVWDANGVPTTYNGTLVLNGGTLETQEVVQGGGSPSNWTTGSVWTWSGGTLEAGLNGLLVSAPATLGSGGAIINPNSATATFTGVLSGSGSLTNSGAGLTILSAVNTYTGGTTISAGAVEATNNQSLGTQPITITATNGLELANGVSLPNNIGDDSGFEAVNVPFTSASATLAGNISQTGGQYRLGITGTGATLTLTGASTVNTNITMITQGNIVFAQNGSLTANTSVEFGRESATSTLNLTVENNASISATAINLGGLDGSSDDLTTNVTLLNNGSLNANTGDLNIDNSATANDTTVLTLSGTSQVFAGGIVETSTATGHTATVNLNGGTIHATASDPVGGSFLPVLNAATFKVLTGGGTINNGGFSITLAQPFISGDSPDGGLTFAGTGTTTITAANSYNGKSTLTAGTLVIDNTSGSAFGSGNITLNGGVLANVGSTGSFTGSVLAGTGPHSIAPGGIGTTGTLALTGLTTNSFSTIDFDLGSGAGPEISNGDLLTLGSGAVSIGSGTLLNFSSTPVPGDDYRLIGDQSGGTVVDAIPLTNFSLSLPGAPAGLSYVLSNTVDPGYIDLVVVSPPNLTWNNAGGASPSDGETWDTNNNNWSNGTVTANVYTNGANVTFNDANSGHYAVTLNTTVNPASVTVNASGNYSISGAGTIGGAGSLTKSGTGTLTLSTPNTYSGGTTVTAGRLLIEPTSSTTSALPTGALSISGNGIVQLADNVTAGTALGSSNVVLTSLSITGTGTLDIGNNRIIIDYSSPATDPIASIAQWIKNGFFRQSGPSIISSDVVTDDAVTGYNYGIGYADGADGLVAGLPSGEIEIMLTLLGDANLDGTVNTEDFTLFSQHLGKSGMMWDDGDFNYDGTVNTADFTLFSANLGQSASLAAQAGVLNPASGLNLANVPEPATAAMMVVAGLGILRQRRSSRR